MDVKVVQAELARFAAERGWDATQTPRNLAVALAIEASVVLELFKWQSDAEANAPASARLKDGAAGALADVLLQALRLADRLGVDLDAAVAERLARNAAKYPLPRATAGAAPAPAEAEAEEVMIVDLGDGPAEEDPAAAAVVEAETAPPPAAPPSEPAASEPAPPAPTPTVEAPRPRAAPVPSAEAEDAEPAKAAARSEKPLRKAPRESAEPPLDAPPPPAAPAPAPATPAAPPTELAIEMPPPPPPPPPEPHADLDPDGALALAKSLAKKLDQARSRDPLLREIHDELETLKRALYAPKLKKAWVAGSLKTLRGLLESAAGERCGEEIDAARQLVEVDRLLAQ